MSENNKTVQNSSSSTHVGKTDTYEKRNGGGTRTFQPKKPIKPSK